MTKLLIDNIKRIDWDFIDYIFLSIRLPNPFRTWMTSQGNRIPFLTFLTRNLDFEGFPQGIKNLSGTSQVLDDFQIITEYGKHLSCSLPQARRLPSLSPPSLSLSLNN
jgi:hypothetical protein